jgi:hypothetical protein
VTTFQLLQDLRAEQVEVGRLSGLLHDFLKRFRSRAVVRDHLPKRLTLSLRSARMSAILLSMSSVNSITVLLSKMTNSITVSYPVGFGKGADLSVSGSHEDMLLRCWEGAVHSLGTALEHNAPGLSVTVRRSSHGHRKQAHMMAHPA